MSPRNPPEHARESADPHSGGNRPAAVVSTWKRVIRAAIGILFVLGMVGLTLYFLRTPAKPETTSLDQFRIGGHRLSLSDYVDQSRPSTPSRYVIEKFIGRDTHLVIPVEVDVEDCRPTWWAKFLNRYMGVRTSRTKTQRVRERIVEIGEGAFYSSGIESVEIPEGITRIGSAAFAGCANLRRVTLPKSVVEIDDRAFENCGALEAIELPGRLKKLGHSAFSGCVALGSIDVSLTTADFGKGVFSGCSKMRKARIQGPLLEIEFTFFRCESLKSVSIPDSIRTFGRRNFADCKSLEEFCLPKRSRCSGRKLLQWLCQPAAHLHRRHGGNHQVQRI
jgi:BspA type Leucine rich repeat region (6 copies)